jgi:hypothetical protein
LAQNKDETWNATTRTEQEDWRKRSVQSTTMTMNTCVDTMKTLAVCTASTIRRMDKENGLYVTTSSSLHPYLHIHTPTLVCGYVRYTAVSSYNIMLNHDLKSIYHTIQSSQSEQARCTPFTSRCIDLQNMYKKLQMRALSSPILYRYNVYTHNLPTHTNITDIYPDLESPAIKFPNSPRMYPPTFIMFS